MGYASRAGRARTSSRSPQAFGVCDRCGIWNNHSELRWQFDWAGASMINKRLLVCDRCLDVPQPQLRAIVIPADPMPTANPRTEAYANAETDRRRTVGPQVVSPRTGLPIPGGDTRVLSANDLPTSDVRVTQQTGGAQGSLNQEPGTDPNAPGDDDPGLPLGFTEVPKTGPL